MTNERNTEEPAEESGEDQVQEKMDAEQEQGYVGVAVDPTPNENYTVAGVTAGLPTPETDGDAKEEARKASGFR